MLVFWRRVRQLKPILIALLLLVFIFLYLWSFDVFGASDLWVNLLASLITLVFTLFLIDYLLEQRASARFRDAYSIAKWDLTKLSNMCVSYMAEPLGFTIFRYESERNGRSLEEWSSEAITRMLRDIRASDILNILQRMNPERWKRFAVDITFVKINLSESLNLYGEILPPELLGKFLKVNSSFVELSNSFVLFSDLFTKEENNWPANRGGVEQNRLIREIQLPHHAKYLNAYFKHVAEFYEGLNSWNP